MGGMRAPPVLIAWYLIIAACLFDVPTRATAHESVGGCEGDNATAVALCNSLVGKFLNSPYNASRIAYVCDPDVLYSDYRCECVGINSTVYARPHPMETRDLAPDGRRHVVDERGRPKKLPAPFRNGDKLARAKHEVDSSERNYVLAFEMFGVMRNAMFFRGPWITDDDWRKWHSPLTDCGLDDDDVYEVSKSHSGKLGRQLNRTMVLRMIRFPMYNGGDVAAQMEHYADAVLADFLCVVAPELVTDVTYQSWPHRSRCDVIRSALSLSPGRAPDCWLDAYRRFYSDQGPAYEPSGGATRPGGYWDEQAKRAGRGYQPTEREREVMASQRDEANAVEKPGPGDYSNEISGMTDGVTGNVHGAGATEPTEEDTTAANEETTRAMGATNQDGVEAVPGQPLTDEILSTAPGWPTRVLYSAWRQQPGVTDTHELLGGLVKHCVEVKAAADELELGGSCDVTPKGVVTGLAEGSAFNVAEMTKWIIKSFHATEFGESPTLLGPTHELDTEFSSPTEADDYPYGYLDDKDKPATAEAKDEL